MFLNEIIEKSQSSISEGGNLAVGGHEAQQINLQVTKRSYIVPVLNDLLSSINSAFSKQFKKPLWNPKVLQSQQFLSGSSLHFFNVQGIPDEEFIAKKPKVGDIDTMVPRDLEPSLEQFLTSAQGKKVGNATCLGFKRGNEQFSSLWELQDPPIKVQIDLEFVEYEKDQPSDWAKFSHSSSWDDLGEGVKGVFHKWFIQSLTGLTTQDFILRKLVGRGKARAEQDIPSRDNMISFAVSSKEGGGLRAKYEPVLDDAGNPLVKDGLPVMRALPAQGYEQNLGKIFQSILGHRVDEKGLQQALPKTWSFVGLLDLANAICTPEEKQTVADGLVEKCYGQGAQGLYKGDPQRDAAEKDVALNAMFKKLGVKPPANFKQLKADYVSRYKVVDESIVFEADEQPAVQAQLRKNMPHLKDLKPADFLDLLDEIHDGNGKFKLQNIPLNVKVDGFGGRFGKDAEGKPFMGTSNTPPRYQASFVDYHKEKGTTDPDILNRAQLFDDLFNDMMNAIKQIDSNLNPKLLVDRQVTCEVLYLPFATETPEGKLRFVGIHYDKLPDGVKLALVPYRVVIASTGEEDPKADMILKAITGIGKTDNVMFISNRLTQQQALDVTAIVPPLENIEQLKSMLASRKRDQVAAVKAALEPVKLAFEKAVIEDPNIIGKDLLGKDYEGIVINSRLGPIKITSQEQRDVIKAKQDAKASARQERPREDANKTAVVAIGSFVGHIGHEQLWDYTLKKAKEVGGTPYLFIGNAEGKNDPIPVPVKVETWHKLYPEYAKNISAVMQGGSLMQKIKHELINPLPGKPPRYDNIYIMVGEDQANMPIANALMKAVNKFPGYEHVKVQLVVTPRGTGMSFTKLRNILVDKNATPEQQYQLWAKAFNEQKLGKDWILHLMELTRKGMGAPTTAKQVKLPKQAAPKETMAGVGMLDNPERNATVNEGAIGALGTAALGSLGKAAGSRLGTRAGVAGAKLVGANKFTVGRAGKAIGGAVGQKIGQKGGQYVQQKLSDHQMNKIINKAIQAKQSGQKIKAVLTPDEVEKLQDYITIHGPEVLNVHEAANAAQQAAIAIAKKKKKGVAEGSEREMDPDWHYKNIMQTKGLSDKAKKDTTDIYKKLKKKKEQGVEEEKQRLDPHCWKGYRKAGTKMKGGKRVNNCVPVGEGWEAEMAEAIALLENFADGKKPGRKGLAKRSGVNTKASVSSLRNTAKHSTGEKARMAHWMANMKAGKAKKK